MASLVPTFDQSAAAPQEAMEVLDDEEPTLVS